MVQVGGGGSGSRWVGGWPRLVRPHDQVQIVALEEFLHHVRPEGVRHLRRRRGGWERVRGARRGAERAGSGGAADPPIILRPPRDLRIRVGPERVAQHARVGHVHRPRHPLQVGGRGDVGRQPTMDAKDLAIDHGGERQAVEKLLEALPQLDRVAPPGRSARPASRRGRGPSRPPAEPSGTWAERPLGHHHERAPQLAAEGHGPSRSQRRRGACTRRGSRRCG